MPATAFRYVKAIPGFLIVAIAVATAPGIHGQQPQPESLVWAPVAKPPQPMGCTQQAAHQVGGSTRRA
jgi:hypothetical protein